MARIVTHLKQTSNAYKLPYINTCTQVYVNTHTRKYTLRAYKRSFIYTYIHTYIHTQTDREIHTHFSGHANWISFEPHTCQHAYLCSLFVCCIPHLPSPTPASTHAASCRPNLLAFPRTCCILISFFSFPHQIFFFIIIIKQTCYFFRDFFF